MGRSVPNSPKQDDTYLGVILGWLLRPSSNTQLINSQPRINNSLPFNYQLDTLKSPMRYFQYDTTNSIPKIQKSPLRYLQTQIHQNDTSNTILRTRYQNFKNSLFRFFQLNFIKNDTFNTIPTTSISKNQNHHFDLPNAISSSSSYTSNTMPPDNSKPTTSHSQRKSAISISSSFKSKVANSTTPPPTSNALSSTPNPEQLPKSTQRTSNINQRRSNDNPPTPVPNHQTHLHHPDSRSTTSINSSEPKHLPTKKQPLQNQECVSIKRKKHG